jgi:hypothetical protein
MAEALEEANSGLTRTLKDLFSGAVGGVAQVLIGMPIVTPEPGRKAVITHFLAEDVADMTQDSRSVGLACIAYCFEGPIC